MGFEREVAPFSEGSILCQYLRNACYLWIQCSDWLACFTCHMIASHDPSVTMEMIYIYSCCLNPLLYGNYYMADWYNLVINGEWTELNEWIMRGGKARTGFWFNGQKWAAQDSGGIPLPKKPYYDTQLHDHQNGRNISGHGSGSATDFKEGHGRWHSWNVAFFYFITIFISFIGWYFSTFSGSVEKHN